MKNQLFLIFVCLFSIQSYSQDSIQLPADYPFGEPGITTRGTFGKDDRKEVKDAEGYEDFVRATAVMVPKEAIKNDRIYGYDLQELLENKFQISKFHKNVKFLNQPTVANCTGFLIAPDIMVTAGHCITTMEEADQYVWLFDYTNELYYNSFNRYITVDTQNIYEVKEILSAEFESEGDVDYAVLRLDRKSNRRPYRFRTSGKVSNGSAINTIGSPTGLPLKFSTNAVVTDNSPSNWFKSNIDSFPGNSGGPVFDKNGFIEGILVRGAVHYSNGSYSGDYAYDKECDCIKTVNWQSVENTAGCQAYKVSMLPKNVLVEAIYENLEYAIENNLDERFDDWDDYDWIFSHKIIEERSPLEERAIILKNSKALERIMDYKADELSDHQARRLIEGAAWRNDTSTLKVLLEAGLYPDAGMDSEETVLQMSVRQNSLEAVEALISYGANINVKDSKDNSLLHFSAERGNTEMTKLLLKNGVSAKLKNHEGEYPDKVAKNEGYKDLGRYLKKVRRGKIKV